MSVTIPHIASLIKINALNVHDKSADKDMYGVQSKLDAVPDVWRALECRFTWRGTSDEMAGKQ